MKGAAVFNYQLTRRLGGGGFGDVWEAEHALTGKKVAVKVKAATISPGSRPGMFRRWGARIAFLVTEAAGCTIYFPTLSWRFF